MRIFWKFFLGGSSWAVGLCWGACKLKPSGEEWASWRDEVMLIINNLYRWALLGTQVAIFNVCYEWRICSVWQVAWERMNGCSYVIEWTAQSSPLLREGGLRNDAARAALWRTRPYECAIDVCQLLTMVIADVCRELSFYLYWFATNSGFVRFDNVVNRIETFEVGKLCRRHMNSCSYVSLRLTIVHKLLKLTSGMLTRIDMSDAR